MFCNHCGAAMSANQVLCSQCGRSPAEGSAGYVSRRRVADHLHLLAVLWMVIGFLLVVPVPIMLAMSGVVRTLHPGGMTATDQNMLNTIGPVLFLAVAVFCGAIACASLLTGWGLLKVQPWGRTLALVMAFLSLLHPPLGTALGVYTLYVLMPATAGVEYDRMAAAAAAAALPHTATS